mmetsp:Transcript_24809/g.57819  ORF Transcript_24809/g.57819 Transcript_24809/m.57819 type:complete len:226 (+) Transcript_24809:236-913(+)
MFRKVFDKPGGTSMASQRGLLACVLQQSEDSQHGAKAVPTGNHIIFRSLDEVRNTIFSAAWVGFAPRGNIRHTGPFVSFFRPFLHGLQVVHLVSSWHQSLQAPHRLICLEQWIVHALVTQILHHFDGCSVASCVRIVGCAHSCLFFPIVKEIVQSFVALEKIFLVFLFLGNGSIGGGAKWNRVARQHHATACQKRSPAGGSVVLVIVEGQSQNCPFRHNMDNISR